MSDVLQTLLGGVKRCDGSVDGRALASTVAVEKECACGLCNESLDALCDMAYLPKELECDGLTDLLRGIESRDMSSWSGKCQHRHHYAYSSYFSHVQASTALFDEIHSGLAAASNYLGKRVERLFEVGGGLGLVAHLMTIGSSRRVEVTCTDLFDPVQSFCWKDNAPCYRHVLKMEASAAVKSLADDHDGLMYVWPLLGEAYPIDSLNAYIDRQSGDPQRRGVVVYIGEDQGTADGEGWMFFERLKSLNVVWGPHAVPHMWNKLQAKPYVTVYVVH
eukprot:Lankesteria_metandrocarpae@DN2644_c0_g1_i2.p1